MRASAQVADAVLKRGDQLVSPEDDATIRTTVRFGSRFYMQSLQQDAASQTMPVSEAQTAQASAQLLKLQQAKKGRRKKTLLHLSCMLALLFLLLLLGARALDQSTDTHTEQQARQSKAQLDRLIAKAQSLGIPTTYLQPVLKKEQALSTSQPPFPLIHTPLSTEFYQDQLRQYQSLQRHLTVLIPATTELLQAQSQQDMQSFQTTLSRANMQPVGNVHYFSQQFSQDQLLVASAHTARDYVTISNDARKAIEALNLLASTYGKLTDFGRTLESLQKDHLDMTVMQVQYQNDLDSFNNATSPLDFTNLTARVDAQYQQVIVASIRAFPYVSAAKLNEFAQQIQTLKTFGSDTGPYQQRLNADEVAAQQAKTTYDDLVFLQRIAGDIAAMHGDFVRGEARSLVRQFHQQVATWARAHPYHDAYDGRDYAPDNGYENMGIGATLDSDLAAASSSADFETMIIEANNALFNLHLFEADSNDQASYDQVHATDLQLLSHYNLTEKQVLVVSLGEQAMRIYQNGHLIRSYHVTTGRQELPSLPGIWSVLDRKSPIIFKAGEPQGSPYWFPDTPINYAILYHYGGYFVHDAPWRANFGPGTQYPHQDASGTTAYNFDGSHGCINLAESDAAWVYHHTDWNTVIAIY